MTVVNLFKQRISKKQMLSDKKQEKLQRERAIQQAHPTAQSSVKYTSQFEEGLMHIVESEYSKMYQLGELDYEVASEDDQFATVQGYASGLNVIDKNSRYQLLVLNKPIPENSLDHVLIDYQADHLDAYREEINQTITQHYEHDKRNFVVEKYAIFTTNSHSMKKANQHLSNLAKNFANRFDSQQIELSMKEVDGLGRLKVMSSLLRPGSYFSTSYRDIALSGLSSKAFIVPNRFSYPKTKGYFRLGEKYGAVLYIKQYPESLEDVLIKQLCAIGIELAISIHAKPYNMVEARKRIKTVQTLNNGQIGREQKANFNVGMSDDMISGEAASVKEATKSLLSEFKDNGQKLFSGIFSVYVNADSEEQLKERIRAIQDEGETWDVQFELVDAYKEEALNTILPIGKPYLDVEMNYMRDMTTANIVTQVPFSNVELQSPTGNFYGRNQLTRNMITVDRKKDLITPSGLILGSSGSGKGMTTKWEIISTYLKYPDDHFIIVDPESEYLPIAREFDAEILDISTGTSHHLNILDMAEADLLDAEDKNVDLVKEKANLLSSLFGELLKEYTDEDAALVDRVTRQLYRNFELEECQPTLVDWHELLSQQEGEIAESLLTKVEPYTIGSQDIFAHPTNVDLTSKFLVFNIKQLDDRLKPFAMKVILDQIWKQVVSSQGKVTTHLYFDELQLNFDTEANAHWFMSLWSRIRKYGAEPTGITQNVATLLDNPSGRRMISNSEFIVLLRQKTVDLQNLHKMITLTPKLIKYVGERVPPGTGLISAGGIIVPFENPIPKDTKLFSIMNTDV